jgi:hypothetical protein
MARKNRDDHQELSLLHDGHVFVDDRLSPPCNCNQPATVQCIIGSETTLIDLKGLKTAGIDPQAPDLVRPAIIG